MLSKTDWLIEQQIAQYFSRLSAVKKFVCWQIITSVNMNEDEEADADDLASEVETDWTRQKKRRDLAKFRRWLQERVQLLLSLEKKEKKKNDLCISLFFHIYCLCSRKQRTMSWDFFIKGNLQEAYWSDTTGSFLINFTSNAVKRRQHSIYRSM